MSDEKLKEAMKIVLSKLGLEPDIGYSLSSITANLWLSAILRVTVDTPGGVTTVIVKRLPEDKKRADYFNSNMFFRNEASAYNIILPTLMDLQKKEGLETDIFDNIPRCLLARGENGEEVIVLEDLANSGFSQVPRKAGLVLEEALLVSRALGRLHALSVVLRHTVSPETFASLTATVKETVFSQSHVDKAAGEIWTLASKFCLQTLSPDLPGGENGKYASKLENIVDNVVAVLMEPSQSVKKNEPRNVFCHGDHYSNNFMFKYESGIPQEVCLLDWQQCRYASPATDVSSLLYLAMEHPGLHHDEVLDEYINSVANMLQRFHMPTSLYTRCHLDQQLKKYAKFAVAVAFLNVPHSLHDHGEEDLNVNHNQKVLEAVAQENRAMSPRARQKLLDIVCDSVNRGYL